MVLSSLYRYNEATCADHPKGPCSSAFHSGCTGASPRDGGGALPEHLERDVRNLVSVTSLRDFERFVRVLAARTACILSYSDVARDVGVAVSTVREWTSVLATSLVLTLRTRRRSFDRLIGSQEQDQAYGMRPVRGHA